MNQYKHLVVVGKVETGEVTYFSVHKNVINGEPNTKYISLYYDNAPKGGVREEAWSADAPNYSKGDTIAILYDPDAKYFNQSSPNRSTLHNKKIQGLLKKYRPELLTVSNFRNSA